MGRHRSDPLGLARIAIAVLAVVVAFGLLIIGGIALWGALTSKDAKPGTATPAQSGVGSTDKNPPTRSAGQIGNTITIHCLAASCEVFVAGPGPNDVQFNGNLTYDERRDFSETRLTVRVTDASRVTVTINGRVQPRSRRNEPKTYEVPASQ